MSSNPQSPFQKTQARFSFGMDWILLVMLVAAATAALLGYAMFLPSVNSEVYAWLGRTAEVSTSGSNRRAHMDFLIACYSAPLLLSILSRVIYLVGRKVTQAPEIDKSEEEFRME